MIKQLGGTRGVPKPSAAVASEALNLLTFLGGNNKAGAKMLADMKDVQGHNEKLLNQANLAIQEANRLQDGVDKSQAKLDADTVNTRAVFEKCENDLDKRNLAIDHKKQVDDNYFKTQKASLSDDIKRVNTAEAAFAAREKALKGHDMELQGREKAIKEGQDANLRLRKDLDARDTRMKAAMGG